MAELGIVEYFEMGEALGIIATLFVVLYFSRKQMQSLSVDIETKVSKWFRWKNPKPYSDGSWKARANKDGQQCRVRPDRKGSIHISSFVYLCTCVSYAPKKSSKR